MMDIMAIVNDSVQPLSILTCAALCLATRSKARITDTGGVFFGTLFILNTVLTLLNTSPFLLPELISATITGWLAWNGKL